jgi:hypothetical protein
MAILRFNSLTLACLGLAMLAGCSEERAIGGGVPPSGTGMSSQAPNGASAASGGASAASGDLLYVTTFEKGRRGPRGVVSILTFPGGRPVANIFTAGFGTAACSDESGNVWVVVDQHSHWNAYEFAHGGTKPIAKIHIPHPNYASGCAVDPTTGNLAVLVGIEQGSGPRPAVDVWAGAREGTPAVYPIAFTPFAGAYDDGGNLFVDGYIGSTVFFEFAELAKGSSSFVNVTLDKRVGFYPGGVQWDGKYIALVPGPVRGHSLIYRVKVAGTIGKVVGEVDVEHLSSMAAFSVKDGKVAATTGAYGGVVTLTPYPAGGRPTKTLARLPFPAGGLAISSSR